MMRIRVLDAISAPGNPARPNEDRYGHNGACAFVIDGATGLGDRQYLENGSDAAWIAAAFAQGFDGKVTASSSISDIVRIISTDARAEFETQAPRTPRYAWPLAAFAMVHATDTGFDFIGLADSCFFLLDERGNGTMHTAIPDAFVNEQAQARRHIERTGGILAGGGPLRDTETLATLRRHRERQNKVGSGVWTLGLVPEAADHLATTHLPIDSKANGILCSDGLADLVVLYHAYDAAGLVSAALSRGLSALVDELRHFEREIDPEGLRFPRYKQSDDTTAILIELTVAP